MHGPLTETVVGDERVSAVETGQGAGGILLALNLANHNFETTRITNKINVTDENDVRLPFNQNNLVKVCKSLACQSGQYWCVFWMSKSPLASDPAVGHHNQNLKKVLRGFL